MRRSTNEYTYGQPANPIGTISMTKLKNRFKAEAPELTLHKFSNSRVNGVLEGAGGFVQDPATQKWVYLSSAYGSANGEILVRAAKGPTDYSGGMNHFTSLAEMVRLAKKLLA